MAGSRLVTILVRSVRRRTRHAVVVAVLAATSIGLLVGAAFLHDYAYDLSLNLGASLVLVIATYLIFNPLFAELQASSIQEHPRLDHPRFIHEVETSQSVVNILETWTGLLEAPYLERFLDAMRVALERGVAVRILLLDPDSNAARQRTEELGGHDVPSAITTNLRDLYAFWRHGLRDTARRRLDIRIYDAMPSVQLYRWDDKAFISFYPLGKLAYDTPQIEAFMATPWGEFVQDKFEELWGGRETVELAEQMSLAMELAHDGQRLGASGADFVMLDGTLYVHAAELLNHVIRYGREGVTVRCVSRRAPGRGAVDHYADSVDAEPLLTELRGLFGRKYGTRPDVVIRLVPDGDRPVEAGDAARG